MPIETFKDYLKLFDKDMQVKLIKMQETIQKAAPKAVPVISYSMPAFTFHGKLVYFAGYKNHIGFYPMPSAITAFQKEIEAAGYTWAKGSVQFPNNKPLPLSFITRVVKFRINDNLDIEEQRALKKAAKKTAAKKKSKDQ